LRLQNLVSMHSDILQENIRPPLVIAGIPRTGGVFLHNLFCQSPDINCIRYHEALFPVVPGEIEFSLVDSESDPRVVQTKGGLKLLHWLRPLYQHMYELGPLVPFEEHQLGSYVFASTLYQDLYVNMTIYNEWWDRTDHVPMYEFIRRCLQVFQWQGTPSTNRKAATWLLKSPQNAEQMNAIWKVFPGAQFILTHRDILVAVKSHLNLVAYTGGTMNDDIDVHKLAQFWLKKIHTSLKQMESSMIEIPPENVHHIKFETMVQNATTALRKILGYGVDSRNDPLKAFNFSNDEQPIYKDETLFEYSLEPFNITEEEVSAIYRHYSQKGSP